VFVVLDTPKSQEDTEDTAGSLALKPDQGCIVSGKNPYPPPSIIASKLLR
jgi:hypothetical protein